MTEKEVPLVYRKLARIFTEKRPLYERDYGWAAGKLRFNKKEIKELFMNWKRWSGDKK